MSSTLDHVDKLLYVITTKLCVNIFSNTEMFQATYTADSTKFKQRDAKFSASFNVQCKTDCMAHAANS